eukprot:GHVT01014816.1.p1 GENE.GHVT01014816.1~~GHVT01014816.1.p1  ORF type:complete len:129 (-),score=19.68 GHVT01014816.1:3-389(-)
MVNPKSKGKKQVEVLQVVKVPQSSVDVSSSLTSSASDTQILYVRQSQVGLEKDLCRKRIAELITFLADYDKDASLRNPVEEDAKSSSPIEVEEAETRKVAAEINPEDEVEPDGDKTLENLEESRGNDG